MYGYRVVDPAVHEEAMQCVHSDDRIGVQRIDIGRWPEACTQVDEEVIFFLEHYSNKYASLRTPRRQRPTGATQWGIRMKEEIKKRLIEHMQRMIRMWERSDLANKEVVDEILGIYGRRMRNINRGIFSLPNPY